MWKAQHWLQHSPASVAENDSIKILWDFNVFVDHLISVRRPDIVIINKKAATMSLIDIAVPAEKHISAKKEQKIKKYQDL